MLFAWAITVPADTAFDSPITVVLSLPYGVVTHVDIKFLPGCHDAVNVRILHEESPLVPLNKDTWLVGDNETVPCDVFFDLLTQPFELKFIAASPGTLYSHEIVVRVTVLDPALASPYQAIADLISIFKTLLGVTS